MTSRKPSLGFTLLIVSLLMAAIGAFLGLGITYFHEVQREKQYMVSDFSSKISDFAQRLNADQISRLESDAEDETSDIGALMASINYTMSAQTRTRIKVFIKRGENKRFSRKPHLSSRFKTTRRYLSYSSSPSFLIEPSSRDFQKNWPIFPQLPRIFARRSATESPTHFGGSSLRS